MGKEKSEVIHLANKEMEGDSNMFTLQYRDLYMEIQITPPVATVLCILMNI